MITNNTYDNINPRPCPLADKDIYKNALCPEYDKCLGQAVDENWTQFTCDSCSLKNNEKEGGVGKDDMRGYYLLLKKIFVRKDGTMIYNNSIIQ